jgi:hypothetical protein
MATETRTDVRAAENQPNVRTEQMRAQRPEQRGAQPSGAAQPMMRPGVPMRGDETKLSIKTTEFWIYMAAVGAILIASQAVGRNAFHLDYFRADKAWFFITLLPIGYLGSRGLAKAGSNTRGRSDDERR